jgi:type III pantothenate kinase
VQVKLLIDIGNSRIKAGVVARAGQIDALEPRPWRDVPFADSWSAVLGALPKPASVHVSNVAGEPIGEALRAWLDKSWGLAPRFVAVRPELAGVRTCYENPAQLGVDRWLGAVAGHALAGGAVCVVGAGTALTIDVVDRDGRHVGGMIAPGLSLMVQSLTRGTAQLRLDEVRSVARFATNTADAISLGCCEAVAGLVARVAERWAREIGGEPTWIATGGGAPALLGVAPVPLRHVPDLVLQGIALFAERDG